MDVYWDFYESWKNSISLIMRLCIILFIVPRSVVFHNQSFCATCEGDLIYQFFFFLKIFKIVFDDSSYNNDVEQFMYILNPKISVGRKLNSGYIRCKYAIYRILVKKLWKWVSIELFCRRKRHDWMVHRKWRIELKTGKETGCVLEFLYFNGI